MTTFSKKSKKLYFGAILALFAQSLSKNDFQIFQLCTTLEKIGKNNDQFMRKIYG